MLVGLGNNTVITGAFAGSKDGACPMMAAHREGGRTSCCTFPEAWDRFCGVHGRDIVRPATEYEVLILCEEIEASLQPLPNVFSDAIAEYQASREARADADVVAERGSERVVEPEGAEAAAPPRKRRLRITGDHIDLSEAIDEHKDAARSRRSREAEDVGLDWLFESTLVLPEDFDQQTAADEAPAAEEFDFDSAEAQLAR